MAKDKYLALDDFQYLWTNSIKPWINGVLPELADIDEVRDIVQYETIIVD